jgi:hypothetical protein
MKFTVSYTLDAEAHLTELWLAGPDRADITAAQDRIDRILAANPFQGIEVREGLFALIFPPLKIFFEINEDDRFVNVTGVGKLK